MTMTRKNAIERVRYYLESMKGELEEIAAGEEDDRDTAPEHSDVWMVRDRNTSAIEDAVFYIINALEKLEGLYCDPVEWEN